MGGLRVAESLSAKAVESLLFGLVDNGTATAYITCYAVSKSKSTLKFTLSFSHVINIQEFGFNIDCNGCSSMGQPSGK